MTLIMIAIIFKMRVGRKSYNKEVPNVTNIQVFTMTLYAYKLQSGRMKAAAVRLI